MNNVSSRKVALGAAGLFMAVLAWYLIALGPMRESPLPAPAQVFSAMIAMVQDLAFWESLGITMLMAAKGFAWALLVGVLLGMAVGWFGLVGKALSFVVEFLKPIPPIVIMPLAILVLGPTQRMGEFLVFYGCLLPILYQTAAGVRETDPVAIQTSRSYGVGTGEILGRVVLPSASAFIATAIRTAIPISLIVSVVAGLLGGGPGLGSEIQRALSANETADLYGLVLILGAVGLLLQLLSGGIESKVLSWHPSYRKLVH
ncbi:ABC transporter permease subunit [Arthrobacter sp. MYb213]|uniref:ABC transporter permease n=1 Tax=Arthrobacter sp. MYb213 TaxID=1848595 RepID=UPI00256FC5EB|nr:ABC transporter permease subunit [Arthrobacter sp. MYb213]